MVPFAGRLLRDIFDNVAGILAIECLAACQGLDFSRPLLSSESLLAIKNLLCSKVSYLR